MTKTTYIKLLLIFLLLPSYCTCQSDIAESLIENIIENAENAEINLEDIEFSDLNIVEINNISDDNIMQLPFLSPIQKNNLREYRIKWGNIYSGSEICLIDGFDKEFVDKIKQYISYKPKDVFQRLRFRDIKSSSDHELLIRAKAATDKDEYYNTDNISQRYAGDRHSILLKYKYSIKNRINIGLTYEKDAGEKFYDSNIKRPENISGYLSYNGKWTSAVLGDYYIQFGQGLACWTGQSFASCIEINSQIKYPQYIKAKSSTDEAYYLRGVALKAKIHGFRFVTYFSYRNKDATLDVDENSNIVYTSISNTGYHRTKNELSKRNALWSLNTGGGIGYSFQKLKLFSSFNYQQYEFSYLPKDFLENYYKRKTASDYNISLDFVSTFKSAVLYGEGVISNTTGVATVVGLYIHANTRLDIDCTIRYKSNAFNQLNANSIFKSNTGERGIAIKTTAYLSKYATLYTQTDICKPDWITTSKISLRAAQSNSIKLVCNVSRTINISANYKNSKSTVKIDREVISASSYISKHTIRFQLEILPNNLLSIKSRIETVFTNKENGILIYQDVGINFTEDIALHCRLTTFKTDSYSAGINSYENDVLYNFSAPRYYGIGYSAFGLLRYKISRDLSAWIKIYGTRNYDRINEQLAITVQLKMKI